MAKNDGLYTINLSGVGANTYAILAQLNVGNRAISITQTPKKDPESYPDALVLAYATVDDQGGVTLEDTRSRTDICGLIDSAGNLSIKIDYAINYIDTQIEGRLDQIEQQLQAQSAELDGKIDEANKLVSQISPPSIGTIQFSASQNIEEGWLRCDGSFINEAEYPELVAALGKNYPSGDKFKLISDGNISPTISNGVIYSGYLWVFSLSNKTLFGVPLDVEGGLKEIPITCSDLHWNNLVPPSLDSPLCLSIVPHINKVGAKLFISQIKGEGRIQGYKGHLLEDYDYLDSLLLFGAEFAMDSPSLEVSPPFSNTPPGESYQMSGKTYYYYTNSDSLFVPYVTSIDRNGEEVFLCVCGMRMGTYGGYGSGASLSWKEGGPQANVETNGLNTDSSYEASTSYSRGGFSRKNHGEAVTTCLRTGGGNTGGVQSTPNGLFESNLSKVTLTSVETRNSLGPMCLVSSNKILSSFDLTTGIIVSRLNSSGKIGKSLFPSIPSSSRLFVDAGVYAWGKDMFFLFVGTGILFSRTLEPGDWGYLDTSSIMGIITQFGYLDYDENSGTLYLMGQDTNNVIKVAKLVLNTLYDYANDGAWLPLIASDGIPAYIKAKEVV